jgi:serine/threonine protein kinase
MAEEVASGLEYLSATHGKIVTDLNPDNINQREDGSIVLSDIGLSATIGGAGPGKPKEEIGYDEIYSAPELAKGTYEELVKNVSPRNEVYSLALIIYHKLGGRIPTVMDVQMGVKDVNLIKEISGISAETLAVLKKGTSVKPEDRYASPGEFVEAFEKSL